MDIWEMMYLSSEMASRLRMDAVLHMTSDAR